MSIKRNCEIMAFNYYLVPYVAVCPSQILPASSSNYAKRSSELIVCFFSSYLFIYLWSVWYSVVVLRDLKMKRALEESRRQWSATEAAGDAVGPADKQWSLHEPKPVFHLPDTASSVVAGTRPTTHYLLPAPTSKTSRIFQLRGHVRLIAFFCTMS